MQAVLPNGERIEIDDSKRTLCEVWTRVMGYYRPIQEFNIAKKQEHKDWKYFNMPANF